MRSLHALFAPIILAAATILAGPVGVGAGNGIGSRADGPPTLYTLRISADVDLDGQSLAIRNGTVGVFPGEPAAQLYPLASPRDAGRVSLHTWPVGVVDHALGLVGSSSSASSPPAAGAGAGADGGDAATRLSGLLTLRDIPNPAGATFPAGTQADWTSFTMGRSGRGEGDGSGDGSGAGADGGGGGQELSYAGGPGGGNWLVFPLQGGQYKVAWYDGTGFIIETYKHVNVSLVTTS